MRRLGVLALFILVMGLDGCAGKNIEQELNSPIVSEDYDNYRDHSLIFNSCETEKGYYYIDCNDNAYKYYDVETDNNIYLCNKPECRHDGNIYCVATNDIYTRIGMEIYSNRIIAAVIENTDTDINYKLMTVSFDGSQMSDFVTYMSIPLAGNVIPDIQTNEGYMYIHRNKAFLPIRLVSNQGLEDSNKYGLAIVDLTTKEVEYLDEEPLAKENEEVTDISVYGDYFYYCRRLSGLHRYNFVTKEDEVLPVPKNIAGRYVVADDDNIYYLKAGKFIGVYHPSTGEIQEMDKQCQHEYVISEHEYGMRGMIEPRMFTDGEYLYFFEARYSYNDSPVQANVWVYDTETIFTNKNVSEPLTITDIEPAFIQEYIFENVPYIYTFGYKNNKLIFTGRDAENIVLIEFDKNQFLEGKLQTQRIINTGQNNQG